MRGWLRELEQRCEVLLIRALEINRQFDPQRSPVELAHLIEDDLGPIHQLNQARAERTGSCEILDGNEPLCPIGREKKTVWHLSIPSVQSLQLPHCASSHDVGRRTAAWPKYRPLGASV